MTKIAPPANANGVSAATPLSELRALVSRASNVGDSARLARNVQQSLRVEGYDVPVSFVELCARRAAAGR